MGGIFRKYFKHAKQWNLMDKEGMRKIEKSMTGKNSQHHVGDQHQGNSTSKCNVDIHAEYSDIDGEGDRGPSDFNVFSELNPLCKH